MMDHRNSFETIRLHRIESLGGLIALLLTGCLQTQTVDPVNSAVSGTSSPLRSQARSSSENQLVQTLRPSGKERGWKHIVLHHTATDQGSVASINASHQERKGPSGKRWLGIGYHFVIGNGSNSSARSDALVVLKNGTITAPSFDIAEITDDKALITKEFADATYAAGTVENPQTPTFILNWEAYGGGYIDPSFYKNNGRVYLQGLLRKTVAFVAGELIFTLPIGYRPSGRVLATGGQSGNTVRVDILANGEVRYMSGGNGSDFISLEGISFRIL